MRRILLFTRFGLSTITSATKKATAVALAVGLMVTVGASQSQAQYPVPYSASAAGAYNNVQPNNGSLFGSSVMKLGDAAVTAGTRSAVVDSAFRGSTSNSNVKSASYIDALNSAECNVGYGPGASCNISWYVNAEAMAFRREGNRRFGLSQNVFLSDQDYEFGGRFTAGKMLDCVNAYEFVYAGPFRWTRTSDIAGAGTINSRFTATPGTLVDAFNGANRHTQILQSDLNSFEMNRRWWAWDAISTLVGIRYINYQEDFQLTSVRGAAPVAGSYRDEIENNLVGLQVGGDVFFPTSLKTSVSLKGKAVAFANFANRELRLQASNGVSVINGADDVDIAGLIELGANGHYQITPSIRLSGGYEVWYMPGMATVSRQQPNLVSSGSGSAVRVDDDVVFHGFTFGAQVLY